MRFLLIIIFLVVSTPAFAEKAPVPGRKTTLGSIQKQLDAESEKKKELAAQAKKINKDMNKTKNRLVETAEKIQKTEQDLKNYEQRIGTLERKKSALEDKLHADRASIAKLVLALERIRRTPPEALIARPDTPYKTAQSALLMGNIIPAVNRHAEKLSKNLETLDRVTEELEDEKHRLFAAAELLKARHDDLSGLLTKRQNLYEKTNEDLKARELSIQKISLQAKNLEELVNKLKEEDRKEKERRQAARVLRQKPDVTITDSGDTRLPISGIIRTGYQQTDELGAKSKGLTIEGRAGALVIAPMNGKVEFAGSFKRYGNIIIIEHANSYYSLIAGLDKISTVVGDLVESGEPIGILPDSSLIPRPTLYYELRKNGKAVNPAQKFPDLG